MEQSRNVRAFGCHSARPKKGFAYVDTISIVFRQFSGSVAGTSGETKAKPQRTADNAVFSAMHVQKFSTHVIQQMPECERDAIADIHSSCGTMTMGRVRGARFTCRPIGKTILLNFRLAIRLACLMGERGYI